jgi:glycosyltransferase involved in cell wall biosynthesis
MENQKLTICFLGSAESIHTLKWAQYFANKKHEVHIISYAPLLKNYNPGDIKLYFLKKKIPTEIWPFNTLLNLPFNLYRVKELIEKIKPNIVHAHYVTSYGTLASLLGFKPLVITTWGSDILVTPQKFLPSKWAVKYALSKADLITCDAEHMKKAMIKLGTEESKIKIINFGIDTKKFSPGPENEKLKKELGFSDSDIVISLRSLDPIYDIETLIKAAPLILQVIPKVKFIIVGKGPQENELRELTKKLNIEESIKFAGFIQNDDLPKYLRTADVYVSTSLSDGGIAASTAEAMACGLPVVITDTGDNRKWIQDNKNGFIIPIKSPKILAERIIYLLKNENLGRKFGEVNRKIIEEKNDYYKEMAKMEEVYQELIRI